MKKAILATGALVVLAAGLAACGEADNAAKEDEPSATTSPATASPSESTTAPLVSNTTTCQLIFNQSAENGESVLGNMLQIVTAETINDVVFAEIKDALDTVRTSAKTAQPDMAAQLDVLIASTEGGIEQIETTGALDLETAPFKAAALEVTNICLGK